MPVKRKTTQEVSAQETVRRAPAYEESSLKSMLGMIAGNFGTVLLVAAAFLIGMLWSEVKYLRKGVPTAGTPTTATTQTQQAGGPAITKEQITTLESGDNLFFGKKGASKVFVMVSDPSCPYCHIAAGENPSLNKSAGAQFTTVADGGTYVPPVLEMRKLVDSGDAGFIWLYYPGHGSGEVATLALYCANDQGKFWEAHDLAMSAEGYTLINDTVKNDRTKSGVMADFLKSVANAAEIKNCIDSGKYDARLASDQATAQSLGISGTPLFFVNTTPFAGAYSYTDMTAALETTL